MLESRHHGRDIVHLGVIRLSLLPLVVSYFLVKFLLSKDAKWTNQSLFKRGEEVFGLFFGQLLILMLVQKPIFYPFIFSLLGI